MLTLTALTVLAAQIQVSSAAVAEGRKLRGGTFRKEAVSQQKPISPAEWESRKNVRYLGTIDYALRAEGSAPAEKSEKPAQVQAPPKPRGRRR